MSGKLEDIETTSVPEQTVLDVLIAPPTHLAPCARTCLQTRTTNLLLSVIAQDRRKTCEYVDLDVRTGESKGCQNEPTFGLLTEETGKVGPDCFKKSAACLHSRWHNETTGRSLAALVLDPRLARAAPCRSVPASGLRVLAAR